MQDSMMIADVGGIVNVSGSRIATPFAPPRPGSTPMMTPRMMPIIISSRLNGESTTAKPWNSALISTKVASPLERLRPTRCRGCSVGKEEERVPGALVERHLEPDLEHRKDHRADDHADRNALQPGVAAHPAHEKSDVKRGRDVDSDELDAEDVDQSRDQ